MPECSIIEPENCRYIFQSSPSSLRIITQNIRSVYRNLDEFVVLLAKMVCRCDIIILTECWLSEDKPPPQIDTYKLHTTQVSRNQNDGVIIYVLEEISCKIDNVQLVDANGLLFTIDDELAILGIYRSPSIRRTDPFLVSLDNTLKSLDSYRSVILMGDINIDIKVNNEDSRSNDYLNLLAENGLIPGHLIPTRDANCLDHVFIKTSYVSHSYVINSHITDHLPVLLNLHNDVCKVKPNKTRRIVNYRNASEEINALDLRYIMEIEDPNTATECLIMRLQQSLHSNTHIKKIPNRKTIIKPWITPGLQRCITHRNTLHKKVKQFPENDTYKTSYRRYRNFCNNLLKKLKTDYEKSEIDKCKNPKQSWQLIRKITNTSVKKNAAEDLLQMHSGNSQCSVNLVNDYFANVGKKLSDTLNNHSNCTIECEINSYNHLKSFVIIPTDDAEVEALLQGLKNDSTTGWDNIPTSFLKTVKNVVVPILTHIFNRCFGTGIFPDLFKKSIIHPIHKGGTSACVDNYRPISVLTALSKLLEKLINSRLMNYLQQEGLLSPSQFGFQPNKSTSDAVTHLVNKVATNLDRGHKCIGIFLDLAKAFDTVSTQFLLHKLERIGIRGEPLKLFSSFLTNRRQTVKIGDFYSSELPVTCGVPQGSVLGPSLFLIYINDLCNYKPTNGCSFAYADDTALIFHGETWAIAKKNAEKGLQQIIKWLQINYLTLNVTKSKYLTFSLKRGTTPMFDLKAHTCNLDNTPTCNCLCLERVNNIRYLGIYLDDTLSWDIQINHLSNRTRKLIWIFKQLRSVLEINHLKTIYYVLAQSVISYCIQAWGGACKTKILKLERTQRSILKTMTNKPFRYPTEKLYKDCRVLTVRQLFILHTIVHKHSELKYDPNLIESKRRSSKVCNSVTHRTAFLNKQYCFLAPFLYNKLNRALNIYAKTRYVCRRLVQDWLLKLNYINTESLLCIIK